MVKNGWKWVVGLKNGWWVLKTSVGVCRHIQVIEGGQQYVMVHPNNNKNQNYIKKVKIEWKTSKNEWWVLKTGVCVWECVLGFKDS